MMRATFFAIGLFVTLWGVSFLVVDKIELNMKSEATPQGGFRGLFSAVGPERRMLQIASSFSRMRESSVILPPSIR